jgi:hypothetical protein
VTNLLPKSAKSAPVTNGTGTTAPDTSTGGTSNLPAIPGVGR